VVAIGWLLAHRRLVRALLWVLGLSLPVALLLPWSAHLFAHPDLARLEAGRVDVAGSALDPAWQLAFGRISATGQAPWWLAAGLTAAAVLALLRSDTRTRVVGAFLVVLAGLGTALVLEQRPLPLPLGAGEAQPWLGLAAIFVSAGAIAAVGLAASDLSTAVASGAFGWRQPIAALAVLLALTTPIVSVVWWVWQAPHGELHRADPVPVPAYMIDAMAHRGERVLLLHTGPDEVTYRVLAGDGLRLGSESVLPAEDSSGIAATLTDLLSRRNAADVARLASYDVGYVVVPNPQDPSIVASLDALPGLSRASTDEARLAGWQVDAVAGPAARTPVSHPPIHSASRSAWVLAQAASWGLVVVLAAPGIRRRPMESP
jgi:hypothetical protein